jgi:ParB family chromosome partitioning protein
MANTKSHKKKKKHLGRGLESLMNPVQSEHSPPAVPITSIGTKKQTSAENGESVRRISVNSISVNPYQPRTEWNDEQIKDLAESIKSNGLIQPIIVRPFEGGYQLIAGERRLRAAKFAELEVIPAIIKKADDRQMLEWALIENIHRTDLNPVERAKAYKNYIESFSLSQSEAAEKLGENRTVVSNYLRILELPSEIREMLVDGRLTTGHAKAILSLPTDQLRAQLANRAMAKRLSVREVERLVKKYTAPVENETKKTQKEVPAYIRDLQEQLKSKLGTRIKIDTKNSGKQGTITIEFYSLDDFDRIVEQMGLNII